LCEVHQPDNTPIHQSCQPPQARAFEQHLSSAQSAPGCALAYASWGPRELTAAEVGTFRFLAVSDAGDGTSRSACSNRHATVRPFTRRTGLFAAEIDGYVLGHVK
jgi:hypothetical protein